MNIEGFDGFDDTSPFGADGTMVAKEAQVEGIDYWRLCDSLSITQATLLVIGMDPSEEWAYVENWDIHLRPRGYEATKMALTNALKRNLIEGQLVHPKLWDEALNDYVEVENKVCLENSTIDVESLKNWLKTRGVRTGFFFPEPVKATEYLNPQHPRYAPKLAAAVTAWEATTETAGKSPKQALMVWLRKHASEYGLVSEEGNPIETAVDDIAKVANWQQEGGAPKTPVKEKPSPPF